MNSSSSFEETFSMGIFLYPGVEELDFCGPFEVLKVASNDSNERLQTGLEDE
jgi:putative intracellular protease/amidase